MNKKPKRAKKQGRGSTEAGVLEHLRQMLMPMMAGIASTKLELTSWLHAQGLEALNRLLLGEAEALAGKKGKHREDRTHYHWGHTTGELSFGGRRIQVERPRVRSKDGKEASLPSFDAFRGEDPLPERVVNQILIGVSTRGYEASLEKPMERIPHRGTSKSAASRHLVATTRKKLDDYLGRRLDELDLLAIMVDGIEIAEHTVVVSLGITADGTKVPLGLRLGSTENAVLCTEMLQDLLERGLRVDGRLLCVIDGGRDPQSPPRRLRRSGCCAPVSDSQAAQFAGALAEEPTRVRARDNARSLPEFERRARQEAPQDLDRLARAQRLR
jgi:putative transposase